LLAFPLRRRLPPRRARLDLRGGGSLVAPPGEPLIPLFDEIWIRRSYLPDTWPAVSRPTIVDIGANVGVFAVWAARVLDAGRLVAVEPSPDMAAALATNLARNNIDAEVLQLGLAGRRGSGQLYRRGAGAMDTLARRDVYGSAFRPHAMVELITLDDLFDRLGIESCDLLKLDCEGAEHEILAHAAHSTLARVDRIALEYHVGLADGDAESLETTLRGHGFDVRRFAPLDQEGGHMHAVRVG
jgi:FkbM family methyltransferase